VLATGLGNPPAVPVCTAKTGQFGSRPVQKSELLTLGGTNLDPYPSTHGFQRVWTDPSVPISGSAYRNSHLWSHSDRLLLIIKKCHGYDTVHLECTGRLNDQNVLTDVPYQNSDTSNPCGIDKTLGKAEIAREVNNNDSNWKMDCGNRFLTSN
jgi:hypothetical protein